MTPPVFAHGNLRLYLLALLEEQPRHGYELIQALSDRFGGTYSPSAGTIYPRLAKLEEEGLVTKRTDGRKSVYEITDAGRAELESRRHELDAIEDDVTDSVRWRYRVVRAGFDSARRTLCAELENAAREVRKAASTEPATPQPNAESTRAMHEADLVITEFRQQLRLEFRNQANRGRVSVDTVSLLRSRLADVRSEVLRELAQR